MYLNELINDSFLSSAYNKRFKSIHKELIFNSLANEKQKNNYIAILYSIENIPPCFNSTKKNIREKVSTYFKYTKELDYYKNEIYYKSGFIDGYNFLLELQNQEGNDNK